MIETFFIAGAISILAQCIGVPLIKWLCEYKPKKEPSKYYYSPDRIPPWADKETYVPPIKFRKRPY